MALEIKNLLREFNILKNGKQLSLKDPNPELTAAEVMKFYSGEHPELTNATVEGPTVVGDKAQYKLVTKAGKLG